MTDSGDEIGQRYSRALNQHTPPLPHARTNNHHHHNIIQRERERERERERARELVIVSWCFKPSQPQKIISGLKETFIKRYIVERTNTAEIRPKEQ